MVDAELQHRIDEFVKHADAICEAHYKAQNYSMTPPRHQAQYISDKWCRVVTLEERNGQWAEQCVYGFVCLQDNTTKTLGTVLKGAIHKPAGYKSPAKHGRGSVYAEDFGKCATPFGIAYLR